MLSVTREYCTRFTLYASFVYLGDLLGKSRVSLSRILTNHASPSALRARIPATKRKKSPRGETTRSPRVRARMLDPRQTVVGGPLLLSRRQVLLLDLSPVLPRPPSSFPHAGFLRSEACVRVSPSFPFIAAHSSASPSRVLGVTAFSPARERCIVVIVKRSRRDPKSIHSVLPRRRRKKKRRPIHNDNQILYTTIKYNDKHRLTRSFYY